MQHLRVILFWAFCSALSAEDSDDYNLMYVNLDNEIENGIHPTDDSSACDCSRERSAWDQLFTMLENSQMRENRLLQAAEDVLAAELRGLRSDVARTCAPAQEPVWLTRTLDELLLTSRGLTQRLAKLESAWQRAPEATGSALLPVLEELRALRRWAGQRSLPAGCETALLFPMRSKKIFGSVHPVTEMKLRSFTACIWVRATDVLNKTVLFSYGTKRNPYEIQLYLNSWSTVLVVGGDQNKLVANSVVPLGTWTYLCGTWNTEEGVTSLWVNGELAATGSGMATGHIIPEGGILQMGQEKNGCCVGGGFDETLAFSGRLTGFNLWDRVLSSDEIRQTRGDDSCHIRGNVVGWGVTEIQPHGGAQYIS
ncbi:pentraxin-related protein PTX3 [Vombatus ursinus]|uniref:pentraxin-related protein PTX3 n=1 Tax=Vombatus ursinus TaxID=29139 RepID=UPI000FFCFCF8|nr:pentraxin-related protein PTX3 [Vombatus ursinus]